MPTMPEPARSTPRRDRAPPGPDGLLRRPLPVNPLEARGRVIGRMTSAPTVLLIEDYAETRAIFRLVLEAGGFEVIEAENAERGLRLASEQSPDVILADLSLPGMSGVEAARLLHDNPATESIPIVAATGTWPPSDLDPETRRWFVEVLYKPVRSDDLLRAVKDAYQGGRALI